MSEQVIQLSPQPRVRQQTQAILAAGTTEGHEVAGKPVVLLTLRGARSGTLRYTPVMRVEHLGKYAVVASKGGSAQNPVWYNNIKAHPVVTVQDGRKIDRFRAREVFGRERSEWWAIAIESYPPYSDYQEKTDRAIPVIVLETLT